MAAKIKKYPRGIMVRHCIMYDILINDYSVK